MKNDKTIDMNDKKIASQLATDLFDLIKRYSNHMTSSELIGVLELHKQELIFHHLNQIKKEIQEENDENN